MDERLKVLKMLEQGKITAQEAERLIRGIHGLESYSKGEYLDTVEIHLKGANVRIVQKGDMLHADYDGLFKVDKRGAHTIVRFSGDGEITLPEKSMLEIHVNVGNVDARVQQDFRLYNNMANTEITVEKPANAEIHNTLGNVEIIYLCEPSAQFQVNNNLGAVDIPDFKKGNKKIAIYNKLGCITVERR